MHLAIYTVQWNFTLQQTEDDVAVYKIANCVTEKSNNYMGLGPQIVIDPVTYSLLLKVSGRMCMCDAI